MARLSPVSLTLFAGIAVSLAACDRESGDAAQQQDDSAAVAGNELTGELTRQYAGSELPDFTFPDPDGKELSLASLKGTPVLLNLWATWCAPCVVEMPMLDELAAENEGSLRVITVSQDLKGADLVAPFFAERDFTHIEPWLDTESELSFGLSGGNSVLPTTILYDAEGKEVWRVVGGYHWSGEQAKAEIAEAIAPKPAEPATDG